MTTRITSSGTHVRVDTFHNDPIFPRLERTDDKIFARGKVVAPIDVLEAISKILPSSFGRDDALKSFVSRSKIPHMS